MSKRIIKKGITSVEDANKIVSNIRAKNIQKVGLNPIMREFDSGAKRDSDVGKINYLKALSPLVLQAYGEFMRKNNSQRDGEKREEDNWKKGMSKQSYMESKFRHFVTTWKIYDGFSNDDIIESLLAELFNTIGLLHVLLLEKHNMQKDLTRGASCVEDYQIPTKDPETGRFGIRYIV